jgi:hypothetical protein
MAYAGESYGSGNQYSGQAANAVNPMSGGGLSTEKACAAIVIGSLVALIAVHRGFRGVSASKISGGLVRG